MGFADLAPTPPLVLPATPLEARNISVSFGVKAASEVPDTVSPSSSGTLPMAVGTVLNHPGGDGGHLCKMIYLSVSGCLTSLLRHAGASEGNPWEGAAGLLLGTR